MSYSPGFFKSLFESTYNPEFYQRIKDVSFKRSLGFLFLFSLLVSLVSFGLMSHYLSNFQDKKEKILQSYDEHVPAFEVILNENTLETIPSDFSYYFNVNENREFEFQADQIRSTVFTVQVDTQKTREELLTKPPELSGVYVLKDALVLYTGIQNTVIEYSSLEIPPGVTFSKETVRPILEEHLPSILDWGKKIILQAGTALVFFYVFISIWILSLFSSLFGMAVLLIRQNPIRYPFLLKLSFYAAVPALFIMLLTHLLSISVSFLPFIIYVCYYYYGLMVYRQE